MVSNESRFLINELLNRVLFLHAQRQRGVAIFGAQLYDLEMDIEAEHTRGAIGSS